MIILSKVKYVIIMIKQVSFKFGKIEGVNRFEPDYHGTKTAN